MPTNRSALIQKMRNQSWIPWLLGVLVLAGTSWMYVGRGPSVSDAAQPKTRVPDNGQSPAQLAERPALPEESSATQAATTTTTQRVKHAPTSREPEALTEGGVREPDEAYLRELRQLWQQEPETAVYLAERAESQLQNTPARAAECAWIAVRALLKLKRDELAHQKSRQLVVAYPGTRWAADIQRHMFGGPPR